MLSLVIIERFSLEKERTLQLRYFIPKNNQNGGSLMKEYTGKTIFVGMDVHKNTYSVTAGRL